MVQVELFAVNLMNPSHMEWTLDGRLLVSEATSGRVKDITSGGDMLNVEPFAHGLKGPSSILPMKDGKILISEMWGGTIRDISAGGDVSASTPWAANLNGPYSLVEFDRGGISELYVTESYNGRDSWVTSLQSDGQSKGRHIDGIPVIPGYVGMTPLSSWPTSWQKFALGGCVKNWTGGGGGGAWYLTISELGQIINVTDFTGEYIDAIKNNTAVAWGLGQAGAMKWHPQRKCIYVSRPAYGDVMKINVDVPQNYHFVPPVVKGFKYPSCVRYSSDGDTMYVCDQADGVVFKVTEFE